MFCNELSAVSLYFELPEGDLALVKNTENINGRERRQKDAQKRIPHQSHRHTRSAELNNNVHKMFHEYTINIDEARGVSGHTPILGSQRFDDFSKRNGIVISFVQSTLISLGEVTAGWLSLSRRRDADTFAQWRLCRCRYRGGNVLMPASPLG